MSDKNRFTTVLTVAVVVLIALNGFILYQSLTLASSQPYLPYQNTMTPQQTTEQKLIMVSGIGVAAGDPDTAVLILGVKTQAETASKAQNDNAVTMNTILEALKNLGILDSEIETTFYSLSPITIYPDRDEAPKIVGYFCRNTIAVTVEDVSKAGHIIDAAVEAGANEVNSIQFKLSDENARNLYEQALENALIDAEKKANVISRSLGVEIIGPIEVSIGPSYQPISSRFESAFAEETPIIPGELKITVTVQVSYLYQ
jgi:uncharacterized protein YggE